MRPRLPAPRAAAPPPRQPLAPPSAAAAPPRQPLRPLRPAAAAPRAHCAPPAAALLHRPRLDDAHVRLQLDARRLHSLSLRRLGAQHGGSLRGRRDRHLPPRRALRVAQELPLLPLAPQEDAPVPPVRPLAIGHGVHLHGAGDGRLLLDASRDDVPDRALPRGDLRPWGRPHGVELRPSPRRAGRPLLHRRPGTSRGEAAPLPRRNPSPRLHVYIRSFDLAHYQAWRDDQRLHEHRPAGLA
mmetsp:Transcript_36834/g.89736  ORF Transcript_36834/g.89736 Transcript_36834/m.89736 type:complete len:241 (-) Transcript_36834:586-1308(-)